MSEDLSPAPNGAAKFSTVSTPTSAPLETLSLDALRRLAETGPDAGTRARARREVEARTAAAGPGTMQCWVDVGRSGFGTPEPRLMVRLEGGARGRRWVQAVLYELAAELERAIAVTPEGWVVGTRYVADGHGFVFVELMDGSSAEVRRATAVLEPLAGTAPTGKSAGRRPGRPRQAVPANVREADSGTEATLVTSDATAVGPDTIVTVAEATPEIGVPAAPDSADESEGRARRRKRQRYREVAGDAAGEFETRQLADDPAMLPACARSALAGGPKSTAYWQWLIERWEAVQQGKADRTDGAS
jgi:hypothetical protein